MDPECTKAKTISKCSDLLCSVFRVVVLCSLRHHRWSLRFVGGVWGEGLVTRLTVARKYVSNLLHIYHIQHIQYVEIFSSFTNMISFTVGSSGSAFNFVVTHFQPKRSFSLLQAAACTHSVVPLSSSSKERVASSSSVSCRFSFAIKKICFRRCVLACRCH